MEDAVRKLIDQQPTTPSNNDFLDDVLDGKPFMRADTPAFRRALRDRRYERALEDRAAERRIRDRFGSR